MDLHRADLAENPLPGYARYRTDGPLIRNDGSLPIETDWIATSREAVDFVFRRADLFSSALTRADLGNVRPLIPLEIDPPDHVRYRRLLDPFFAPKQLAGLEPSLRSQINEFIDSFIDTGAVDIRTEFFVPYPTGVFLTMYGLPLEDRPTFLRWKDAMINTYLDTERGRQAGAEMYEYMGRFIAASPGDGDDIFSQLIAESRSGDGLTVEELLDITYLFMMAGLDTVTNTLTLGFAYLARHPEARAQLGADPALIPGAVEELLRIDTPAGALHRTATADVDVGGVTVHAGETVFCHLGAANGDSTRIPDAEQVDFTRTESPHVSFGSGIHRCVGSHLARLEVRLVLEELLPRIPDFELDRELDTVAMPIFEGLRQLPITFRPGGRTP